MRLQPVGVTSTLAGATVSSVASLLMFTSLAPSRALPDVAAQPGASTQHRGSVWLPDWTMGTALSRVTRNGDLFDLASPFWYDAASCSTVHAREGAGSRTVVRRLTAAGQRVVPTVTAGGLGPRAAIRCFTDDRRRGAHIDRLVRLASSRGYDGIDIDYENLALTTDRALAARVRSAFSGFVEDLCQRMRSRDKLCVITVMARTSDAMRVWRGKLIPGVYDYEAIAASASRMRVMAYDQHAPNTAPGPIAGFPWVRRVVAYTARKAPLGRVELGVPTYGRNWSRGTATTLTGQQAVQLARDHHVAPVFDGVQRELTFGYRANGVRHRVWFSSPRAVAARTALARRRGMVGPAYWAAGLEQRGTWQAVRRR